MLTPTDRPTVQPSEQQTRRTKNRSQGAGSGSDVNSDTARLQDQENLLDKIDEDSFPASDAPSHTPMTGVARKTVELEDSAQKGSRKTENRNG